MRTNRFALFLLLSTIISQALAQTQQGYVKTLGRPDKKGIALSGVSVRLKGGHNAVLSKDDGTFSMLMTGKKVGDAYSLQQVQKVGYELNEVGVIGRQYAFSEKVPLTIVMVSTSQLQADKQRIENNAYKVAERNYKAKLAQLEKDKEAGTITIETYRQALQDLQDKFEKYQSLIDGLAEHYAHTDYDGLDEKEREINICIENGDLERADSLIHTIFNPTDLLKRNKEALSHIDQNLQQANDILSQANADMAAVQKQQEKDAEYLYQLYTISLAKYDNENALKYIVTRAALDTTNVKWTRSAGIFIEDYMADYPKALEYYQRALELSIQQYGEDDDNVASAYNSIGGVLNALGQYSKALQYYDKAMVIRKGSLGLEHPDIAMILNNIGTIYLCQANYPQALENFNKAVTIYEKESGMNYSRIASCYNNIGQVYYLTGDFPKALDYYNKAKSIREENNGTNQLDLASSYSNFASYYFKQQNYTTAIEYLEKALNIRQEAYGMNHPDVATDYLHMGILYNSQEKNQIAINYFINALSIQEKIFGSEHPTVAASLHAIGTIYIKQGNYPIALEFLKRSLDINIKVLGTNHPNVSQLFNSIGGVYYYQGNMAKALEYYEKALSIREKMFSEEDLATSYNNIGAIYHNQQDYSKALMYYNKALAIRKKIFGKNHPSTKIVRKNIDITIFMMNQKKERHSFYQNR